MKILLTDTTARTCSAQPTRMVVLLIAITALAGCHRGENRQPAVVAEWQPTAIAFDDMTTHSGISSIYENAQEAKEYLILEGIGGGVAMLDFEPDGQLDLLFATGGKILADRKLVGLPSTLWRNIGDFRFQDASDASRSTDAPYFSHGVVSADFNNDGFADYLLTGYGGLQLFQNQGDGTFLESSRQAELDDHSWSTSAAWVDQNNDGNLDLYIAHYVDWSWQKNPACGAPGKRDQCTPYDFEGLDDSFYMSRGDGTFADMTRQCGLVASGKGLGVISADFNRDGLTDVYVANDTTNNFFFLNEGERWRETGLSNGTAVDERGIPNGSMGLAVFDFDRDQRPDLWVTNFENETFALYKNDGGADFRCITSSTGINALGTLFVGFGTVAGDFDRDGDEDLAVANGHLQSYVELDQDQLVLRNDAGKRLRRVAAPADSYFDKKHVGRGLVSGDLDGDGALDLVFSNSMEPAALLRNRTSVARDNGWLRLRLVGVNASRDAIGATVVLHCSDGDRARYVCSGGSYLSQNPYVLHWGIPSGISVKGATITWPGGQVQHIADLSVGRETTISEARL